MAYVRCDNAKAKPACLHPAMEMRSDRAERFHKVDFID
jgi:hypothetical protein